MPQPIIQHIAVYPGSFDPVTRGHIEVAERASKLFGRVMVAIAEDADKRHLFTAEERVGMATDALAHVPNITVESFAGLVVDYARLRNANCLVKGLRAISDFEREMQMDSMNRELAPGIETVYVMATPAHTFLSSSLIKQVYHLGGDVSELVTPLVLEMLQTKLEGPRPG